MSMDTNTNPAAAETLTAYAERRRMDPMGNMPRAMSRDEMTAPLAWHEEQLARVHRFGDIGDGTVGYVRIR